MRKILSVTLLPLLAGCLTATEPDVSRWPLEYRPVKTEAMSVRDLGTVRLSVVTVRAPYNRESLTVLRENGTVAFDPYNEFAAQPSVLLRGIVFDAFVASGAFADVINASSLVREDLSAEVGVYRLALDCRTKGERKAVAEVAVRLSDNGKSVRAAVGTGTADAADGNYGEAFSRALSAAVLNALGQYR